MLDGYNEVMKQVYLVEYHVFDAQIARVLEKLPTELRHTLHRNFIPYQKVLP